jgi:hypothetical protein
LEIQAAREKRGLQVEEAKAQVQAQEAAKKASDTALWRARENVQQAAKRTADPYRVGLIERAQESLLTQERAAAEDASDLRDAKKKMREEGHALEGLEGWLQKKLVGGAPTSIALQDATKEVGRLEDAAKASAKALEETRQRLKGLNEEQTGANRRLKEREGEYDELKRTNEGVATAAEKARIKLDELGKAPLDLKAPKADASVLEGSRGSIEELAKSGSSLRFSPWNTQWTPGPFAEKAQEVQRLQGESHEANLMGNFKVRDADNLRITQLKKELGATGALKSADYQQLMASDIAGLYKLALGAGLKVDPANGA